MLHHPAKDLVQGCVYAFVICLRGDKQEVVRPAIRHYFLLWLCL